MDTEALFYRLNSLCILPEALKAEIAGLLLEEKYKKKAMLLKQGQVSKRIYFIKAGFIRAYYDSGRETFTNWFMGDNEIIISVYSFFSQKPAFENIEVLDDCTVQSITWDQLQYLYQKYPEFNALGRILTEQYYIRSEKRSIDLQTLSAVERYQKLISVYPVVLQYATLGQIASYLGIKQETLSRIRAQK